MAGFASPFKEKVEELEARFRYLYSRIQEEQDTVDHLRRGLDLAGIPAQAALDDKAPPLRINVFEARRIMEQTDEK